MPAVVHGVPLCLVHKVNVLALNLNCATLPPLLLLLPCIRLKGGVQENQMVVVAQSILSQLVKPRQVIGVREVVAVWGGAPQMAPRARMKIKINKIALREEMSGVYLWVAVGTGGVRVKQVAGARRAHKLNVAKSKVSGVKMLLCRQVWQFLPLYKMGIVSLVLMPNALFMQRLIVLPRGGNGA